jgi:hypothetical protein
MRRAASFGAALESGKVPDRRELASWPVFDGAIQLGFAELLTKRQGCRRRHAHPRSTECHVAGVRAIMRSLDRERWCADEARMQALASIRERHPSTPVVAFSSPIRPTPRSVAALLGAESHSSLATVHGSHQDE